MAIFRPGLGGPTFFFSTLVQTQRRQRFLELIRSKLEGSAAVLWGPQQNVVVCGGIILHITIYESFTRANFVGYLGGIYHKITPAISGSLAVLPCCAVTMYLLPAVENIHDSVSLRIQRNWRRHSEYHKVVQMRTARAGRSFTFFNLFLRDAILTCTC